MSIVDVTLRLSDMMREVHPKADSWTAKLAKSGKTYMLTAHYGYDFDCPDPEIHIPKDFADFISRGTA